jgi:cytochrome c oxidase cbb3-type subunit III
MSGNEKESKNIIINEEEKNLLLDHDYDGIEEFDYPLPNWWVMTFIGGIVFAIFYTAFYHFLGGPSLADEFEKDMAKINQIREAEAQKTANFDLKQYSAWVSKNNGIQTGSAVYEENCLSCHEANGKGDIGPNLTDKHWINVSKAQPEQIYTFVVNGNEDNGMPAWGDILNKEELYAVVSYVLSLKNTNVAGGKEPQGEVLTD